jgi:hypothetical protein
MAALHLIDGAGEELKTPGIELLDHIRDAFGPAQKLWTVTLLHHLHERDESPWKDVRGKPLDDRGLARRLRGYGVKSRDVWEGGKTLKGYYAADFADAWNRYCGTLHPERDESDEGEEIDNKDKNLALIAPIALNSQKEAPATAPQFPPVMCAHCGREGNLLEASDGGRPVMLHERCIDEYMALGLPGFLERRDQAAGGQQ